MSYFAWHNDFGIVDRDTLIHYSIEGSVLDTESPKVNIVVSSTQIKQRESVTLDGSECTDNVGIVNWTWTINNTDYFGKIIEFTFPDPGAFEIVLEVFDERGNFASGSIGLTVEKLNETVEPDDDDVADPETDDNNVYGMIIAGAVIFIIILVFLIIVVFFLFKRSDKSSGEE